MRETKTTKCILILSSKSAGSSALLRLLTQYPQSNHVQYTRHYENETLYWVKATSILNLPQIPMLDSEVPLPAHKARRDLIDFLQRNLGPSYEPPQDDQALIFDGWHRLCHHYGPIFVEKSPHHLHQWSALELILESMQRLTDVDFLVVGLVRNPMDTLYSMWRRWGHLPEQAQYDWYEAYQNLLKLRDRLGSRLVTIRYRDMTQKPATLAPIFQFMGLPNPAAHSLHTRSLGKWRTDHRYGFQLDEKVVQLAEQFGYQREEVQNHPIQLWPVYRQLHHWQQRGEMLVRAVPRAMKRRLFSE